ncbi:aldehyde dehydrogenase family protein [Mycolicibacterium sp.]|uniref:aldehyde dehydrogenase family protein n=1 Tax=Mycolicibacterium sp. TaxID=2320850 RepID=UPI003D0BF9B0
MLTTPMTIDGAAVQARSAETIEVFDPAHPQRLVGSIPRGDRDDVDAAVRAARAALPGWQALSLQERIAVLDRCADRIHAVTDSLAPLLTREMGKVLAESRIDFQTAEFFLRVLPHEAHGALTDQRVSDEFGSVTIRRKPVGVVGIIVPWNWPMALLFMRVSAALAAGNTVVCLPSPLASLAVLEAVRAVNAELPPGVLNVVTGLGREAGAALTAHPGVDKVSFTGSTATGAEVLRSAAATIKRVSLELGGNDPAIVLDDAVVDDALGQALIGSAFTTTGQVCFAIKRVYVARPLYNAVLESCLAALAGTRVGDGLSAEATMGPLASGPQRERFDGFVADAVHRGATLTTRGQWISDTEPDEGFFRLPTIVTGVDHSFDLVTCEQFGPALPIMPFDEPEEAVRWANGTDFGLGASVWTADAQRGRAFGAQLEAGIVFLNRHDVSASHPRGMFGGVKHSGIGRELGRAGVENYLEAVQIDGLDPD